LRLDWLKRGNSSSGHKLSLVQSLDHGRQSRCASSDNFICVFYLNLIYIRECESIENSLHFKSKFKFKLTQSGLSVIYIYQWDMKLFNPNSRREEK